MVNQILGERYQVERLLGKKAGRRTLLARDLQNQDFVVIKLLIFGNDFEWDDLKLFEREAETLKSLAHPAIPRYLDYLELETPNDKGFALVQTYIEASSLEEQVKAGRTFTETEIQEIAKALLKILVYLHDRQPPVIHRDLKPSNILLANRSGHTAGQVYLVDFGSVQTLAAREGGTITVVGTYGYMPPEQFGGRAVPASDLYSLGATLIYLGTGLHPADFPQVDLKLQFEPKVNFSQSLITWLNSLLEPSLNRRLASAKEALAALEKPTTLSPSVPPPLALTRKPAGSQVLLSKTSHSLELVIPPKGVILSLIGGLFGVISLSLFSALLLAILHISPGFNLLASLVFALCLGLDLWLIGKIIFTIFGQVRLQINSQKLVLSGEVFGYSCFSQEAPRQNICKLVQIQSVSGVMMNSGVSHGQILTEPELILWAGTKKIILYKGRGLTDPELDWIAGELSHYLGLPISKK